MSISFPHPHRRRGVSPQLDPLIEEAWARRRRRRRRWLAVGLLAGAAAALSVVLSRGTTSPPPPPPSVPAPPVQATAAQVSAFLTGARRALDRRFAATYSVTVPRPHGRSGHATVVVAQRSGGQYVFRETPSFGLAGTGFAPAAKTASSEMFSLSRDPRKGGYTCTGQGGHWSCIGPYTGIGMGTTWLIWGPYPPQNLFLDLQNAVATYGGTVMTRPHRRPMYIVTRRRDGGSLQCLEFGRLHNPVGTVCLNRFGLIAFYDVPQKLAVSSDYRVATLESYSTRITGAAFVLPSPPKPYPS